MSLIIYCAGLICGVIAASWVVDMIENLSYRKRISADDIRQLGEALKK